MKNVTNWNCTLLDANGHGYLTMFVELDHGFLLYDKLDNGELAPAVPWMNIIGHETYGPWQWYPSLPAFGGTFSNSFWYVFTLLIPLFVHFDKSNRVSEIFIAPL